MALLNARSLAATLDAVNDALFFGRRVPKADAARVARWLAGRQALPGSYADMFAPTAADFAGKVEDGGASACPAGSRASSVRTPR